MEEREFARYAFLIVAVVAVVGLLTSGGGITGFAAKVGLKAPTVSCDKAKQMVASYCKDNPGAKRCKDARKLEANLCKARPAPRSAPRPAQRQAPPAEQQAPPQPAPEQQAVPQPAPEPAPAAEPAPAGLPLGAECMPPFGPRPDCASGVCGTDNSNNAVCEEPNQALCSRCNPDGMRAGSGECSSGYCDIIVGGSSRFVCKDPNNQTFCPGPIPVGAPCDRNHDCATLVCDRSNANMDNGWMGVCV